MMSARIQTYSDNVREWAKSFFSSKPTIITTHRCCININPKEVIVTHTNQLPDKLDIYLAEKIPYETLDELSSLLKNTVKKNALLDIPTTLLLNPSDYQLFLIESLPVKKEEIRDAVKWRVRSLINYPIEEAILDYFIVPAKKASPNNPMIAAVVSRLSQIIRLIDVTRTSNLLITSIDIPELAMRNLTSLIENDEKSSAFIYFYENIAILNITREKTLYFTRPINLPKDLHSTNANFEPFTLDILRYFDYFQSMWRLPTPSRIFTASDCFDTNQIIKAFADHLSVKIEVFSLNNKLPLDQKQTTIDQCYMLPIGCILQEDETIETKN